VSVSSTIRNLEGILPAPPSSQSNRTFSNCMFAGLPLELSPASGRFCESSNMATTDGRENTRK
jgi:hypothetical protein